MFQSYSLQGKRESNEDEHVHYENIDGKLKSKGKINFMAVFDGHGGKGVSKYLKNNLANYFVKKSLPYSNKKYFSNYILNSYNLLQQNLIKTHPKISQYSGSTACVCILFNSINNLNLWIINVGDSRCVLCNKKTKAVQLSYDHKPNTKLEKSRIEKLGGKIYFDGYDWRIKDLSLSRAFGDTEACPYVTHLPFIHKYKISKKDKFIILACDGLWDVISNQRAVNYVLKYINKKDSINISKKLAEYAIEKGSMDNVTVVIFFL